FREKVIRAEVHDWEAHRSILRDAMIETFIAQHVADPDEWFTKVPTYLRQGTSPIEKNTYLNRICEIVGRIGGEDQAERRSRSVDSFELTSPVRRTGVEQRQLPLGFGGRPSQPVVDDAAPARRYVVADFSAKGLQP